jgi:hypothetical protein
MPLHPSSVKSSAPRRALKRSAGRTDQRRSTCPRTVTPAVALTALAALANEYLPPALGPRTIEDPIPLVDHRRPARQFLDKRREASDTTSSSRDHAAPRKLGPLIRAFFLLWGARRCNRARRSWPRSVPNSGCHPRSAPDLRGLGQPPTLPGGRLEKRYVSEIAAAAVAHLGYDQVRDFLRGGEQNPGQEHWFYVLNFLQIVNRARVRDVLPSTRL